MFINSFNMINTWLETTIYFVLIEHFCQHLKKMNFDL